MGSSSSRLASPQPNDKFDNRIDSTLKGINYALTALGQAADYVPVAGANKIVPAVQQVVEMVQRTRSNDQAALGLAEEVLDLVRLITETMEDVRRKIESIESSVPQDIKSRIDPEKTKQPKQSNTGIKKLLEDLEGIPDRARGHTKGNFFWKCLCIDTLEAELQETAELVKKARRNFRDNQATFVGLTVEHVHNMIGELLRMAQEEKNERESRKDENIIQRLPHAEASYDAANRDDYLEGTRVALLHDLQEWAESTDKSSHVCVLSGAAGTGKSTVARELARRLSKKKQLGASFFFVRSAAGDAGTTRFVFSTIAFQLAASQDFRRSIAEATLQYLNDNKGHHLSGQLEKLILEPLKEIPASHSPVVIILDAVDECSESAPGDLIQMFTLLKRLREIPFPFRVLITTRPEMPIEHAILAAGFEPAAKRFDMDSIAPEDVDADIRHFFTKRFQELYCGRKILSARPDAIERLTTKAERLFIYAQTIIEALRNDKRPEVAIQRLESFLVGENAAGLSALDTLYLTVLENVYSKSDMENTNVRRRVIAVLASIVVFQEQVTLDALSQFFDVTAESAKFTLSDLHSVISFDDQSPDGARIRPLHATFVEFLTDNLRCRNADFYIDPRVYHAQLASSCLDFLDNTLRRNICQLSDPTVHKDTVKDLSARVHKYITPQAQYAYRYWSVHIVRADTSRDIFQRLEGFCAKKILLWFEALSMMNKLDSAIQALTVVGSWYQEQPSYNPEILKIITDGYRLVQDFFIPINSCPEQIYLTALPLAPTCYLLDTYLLQRGPDNPPLGTLELVTPRQSQWDACLRVIEGHTGRVASVKFSSDRRWIVSGAWDNTVRIWDATTGVVWKTLEGHNDSVESVDFHPDYLRVASGSSDGTVREWDPLSNMPVLNTRLVRCGNVFSVGYSRDGTALVSGSYQSSIHVWRAGRVNKASPVIAAKGCINSVAFSQDGQQIVSASSNNLVQIWDASTGKLLKTLKGHKDMAKSAKFYPDGGRVVSGGSDNTVRIWDLSSQPAKCTILSGHTARVFGVDISPNGDLIASGSEDSTIRLWDAEVGSILSVYRGHTSWVQSVCFSSQGDRLASGSDDHTVRIWDLGIRTLPETSAGHTNSISCVVFSGNGKYIATTAYDSSVIIWDTQRGLSMHTLKGHKSRVNTASFSPDELRLASGGDDGARIWDVGSGNLLKTLRRKPEEEWEAVETIAYSTSGNIIATGGHNMDPILAIWNSDGTIDRTFTIEFTTDFIDIVLDIHFSLDDRYVSVKTTDKLFYVWDLVNGVITEGITEETFSSVRAFTEFKFDEGWLASVHSSRRLCWLPESRRPHRIEYDDKSFAIHGDQVALGAGSGQFTLLNMSGLKYMC